MLGLDALAVADLDTARLRYTAAAALHTHLLDHEGTAYALSGLAGLALALDRPEVAGRLFGAAAHTRHVVGATTWPGMQTFDDAQTAALTTAVGPTDFAATRAAGEGMALTDALAYGLANTKTPLSPQVNTSAT